MLYNEFMGSTKTLIPTATCYSKKEFVEWVNELRPYFKSIHLDVVDYSYGPQTWFDDVEIFEESSHFEKIIVHLMVEDPVLFLTNKSEILKKDNTKYIFRLSKARNVSVLQNLKNLGYDIGVCFELGDSLKVSPEIFSMVTEVMFMGVIAGKSGRSTDLSAVSNLDFFVDEYKLDVMDHITVSIDGGFNEITANSYINSKCAVLYVNSFLRKNGIKKAFSILHNIVKD